MVTSRAVLSPVDVLVVSGFFAAVMIFIVAPILYCCSKTCEVLRGPRVDDETRPYFRC